MELTGRILSIGQTVNISCFWRRGIFYLLLFLIFLVDLQLSIKVLK